MGGGRVYFVHSWLHSIERECTLYSVLKFRSVLIDRYPLLSYFQPWEVFFVRSGECFQPLLFSSSHRWWRKNNFFRPQFSLKIRVKSEPPPPPKISCASASERFQSGTGTTWNGLQEIAVPSLFCLYRPFHESAAFSTLQCCCCCCCSKVESCCCCCSSLIRPF